MFLSNASFVGVGVGVTLDSFAKENALTPSCVAMCSAATSQGRVKS